jgi:hypothetical protein
MSANRRWVASRNRSWRRGWAWAVPVKYWLTHTL